MKLLPIAQNKGVVVQSLKDEVLIYDLTTNQAFCLNETATKVFNNCDGSTSFEDLKRRYKYTDEIIHLALDNLKKENLLEGEYTSPFIGMNRREVIKKVGLASMIALPVIVGLVAPTAAMAQSGVACTGVSPQGQTISCANNSSDCGSNANAAACQTCTTAFTTNFPNCIANGFAGACQCT